MTKEEKLSLMENRLHMLEMNGKNFKCPGVVRKIKRNISNLKSR